MSSSASCCSASYSTLISAHELAQHLDDPDWVIFDCRHDLANRDFGRDVYARAHIPGARFLHIDEDLSSPLTGTNGRHPLPDPEAFAQRLARAGVGNETQVIAYDDAGGMFAARLWWMMRWIGHHCAAVLDGGLVAWLEAGQALTAKVPEPAPANFRVSLRPEVVDAAWVLGHLRNPEMLLVDARSPDRYRGENETLDPVGGHIPGAINRFFRDNLDGRGHFKQASILREEFGALLKGGDAHRVVHQCGSGVTACHNLLAMESAGLTGSRLYAGSWSEWCADPARPVATGPER
ncbi:sulfurtransferase [Aromatoleum toluclasticum]|uniref:sulfurtransferase n=1 Tax=Aromatoleum toluclasticum TaxID=92003 RepID=UPI000368E9CF|nr:sulfurtransferase [Aromatoleum toluclasticum]MCC4117013.1 sulfurtransferase [Aromatoleum toluclasticum]